MACRRWVVFCLSIATVGLVDNTTVEAEVMENFSVVVGGNYTVQGSQVWGGAIAGGNVSGNGLSIGSRLTPSSAYTNAITLGVGGDLFGSGQFGMEAGSVHLSGTKPSGVNFNFNGGGSLVQNDPNVGGLANTGVAELASASSIFSGYTANSAYVQNQNTVTFNPIFDSNNVATFNVPVGLLWTQNLNYVLNVAGVPGDATYLFNVIGNITENIPNGNFGSGFQSETARTQMVWNFQDQTSDLNIQREWWGSILLADGGADLFNSSPINGGVYVAGNFIQNADVRSVGYQGFQPAAVPEPSSVVLLGFVGGLAYAARRLKRRKELEEPAAPLVA